MARPDLVEKFQRKAAHLATAGQVEFADEQQHLPIDVPRRVRILQNHAVYAGMVAAMDEAVGVVLDKLEELGLDDRTAVIFTSDNGGLSTSEGSPTSNLPLRGGKGWLYEGGIREPLLIRWPGVTQPGSVCDVPVISTDFYPTILEMADIEPMPEQHRDGLSLAPLLRGQESAAWLDRPLFWHYPHYSNQGGFPGGAVRRGDWKLFEHFVDGRAQLFNLSDDLGERRDLSETESQRTDQLRQQLHAWYREVGARFLRPQPGGPQPWHPPE
jgi:arylsulfatase A-like enzyme